MDMFSGLLGQFNPNELSGQVLVLDTVRGGVETSTGVAAAPGNTVNKWTDWSGNNYHFLQSTDSKKPVYRVPAVGLPYLEFDGVDDYLLSASASGLLLTTKSIYIVARIRSVIASVTGLISSQSGNWYVAIGNNNRMTTSWANGAGSQAFMNSLNIFNFNDFFRFCYTLSLSGSNVQSKHFANGILIGTNNYADGMTTPTASNYVVGAFSTANLFCSADIVAIRVFNRIITDTERAMLDNYYGRGAFNPDQLPGQVLALDVFNQGAVLSTGVHVTDGQPVYQWLDASQSGYHMTQPTSSKRPIYRAGSGLPYLEFDGSDDYLAVANASNLLLKTKTIVVIGRVRATPATGTIFANQNANYWVGVATNNRTFASYSNASATQVTRVSSDNAFNNSGFHAIEYIFDAGSNVVVKQYVDGVLVSDASAATGMADVTANTFVVGAYSSTTNFCQLDIVAIRVFNRVLTDAERVMLTNYYNR